MYVDNIKELAYICIFDYVCYIFPQTFILILIHT